MMATSLNFSQKTDLRLLGALVSPGKEIRTRPQFIAHSGQLIMSRIDARNGAFAIVPRVVTQDFPLFDVDQDVIDAEFLAILLRSYGFLEACKRASRGTTNRKRLKETALLDELVPVPPRDSSTLDRRPWSTTKVCGLRSTCAFSFFGIGNSRTGKSTIRLILNNVR